MRKPPFLILMLLLLLQSTLLLSQRVSKRQLKKENKMLLAKIDSMEQAAIMGQSEDRQLSLEGKCYAQFAIQTQFESADTIVLYEYTGTSNGIHHGLTRTEVLIKESYRRWVAKEPDIFCKGQMADEQVVAWCHEEVPADYQIITEVTDTSRIKEFAKRIFIPHRVVRPSELTELKQVECNFGNRPSTIIQTVQDKLMALGYNLKGAKKNELDVLTRAALLKFQTLNGLPVGQLDVGTLKLIDEKYNER